MAISHMPHTPYGMADDRMRGYRSRTPEHEEFLRYIRNEGPSFYRFFQEEFTTRDFERLSPNSFSHVFAHLKDKYHSKEGYMYNEPLIDYHKTSAKKVPKTWLTEMQAEIKEWLKDVNTLIAKPV